MSKRSHWYRKFGLIIVLLFTIVVSNVAHAGTSDYGFYYKYYAHQIGVQATVSTMSTFNIIQGNPERNFDVYAPTIQPPGEACLEVTVLARRFARNPTTYHDIGAYDSCNGRNQWTLQTMDATWKNKYERVVSFNRLPGGGPNFNDKVVTVAVTRINAPNNCWGAYIWNFNTNVWDTIAANKCGTNNIPGTDGWAMFESYGYEQASSTPMCGALGTYGVVQVRNLKYYYDNLPPPYVTSVTEFDHNGNINTGNACLNPSTPYRYSFYQVPDSFTVCDESHWMYCEYQG